MFGEVARVNAEIAGDRHQQAGEHVAAPCGEHRRRVRWRWWGTRRTASPSRWMPSWPPTSTCRTPNPSTTMPARSRRHDPSRCRSPADRRCRYVATPTAMTMVDNTADPIHHCRRARSFSCFVRTLTSKVNGISQNGAIAGIGDDWSQGSFPQGCLLLVPGRRFRLRHRVLLASARVVRTCGYRSFGPDS